MTDGNQFALHAFGSSNGLPKVGWHIDPFGSSYVTGGLWAQIGFDCFGINRINFQNKNKRKGTQTLEFLWKGSSSLGDYAYIFVHIMDSAYG